MEETIMLKRIKASEDYLNYIKKHYLLVQEAFKLFKIHCVDSDIIKELNMEHLEEVISVHDIYKLSSEEFNPYRNKFFGQDLEIPKETVDEEFEAAWDHHKEYCAHHWQNWTKSDMPHSHKLVYCVEMAMDWIAMGYAKRNSAIDYYRFVNSEINLDPKYEKVLMIIFGNMYTELGALKMIRNKDDFWKLSGNSKLVFLQDINPNIVEIEAAMKLRPSAIDKGLIVQFKEEINGEVKEVERYLKLQEEKEMEVTQFVAEARLV